MCYCNNHNQIESDGFNFFVSFYPLWKKGIYTRFLGTFSIYHHSLSLSTKSYFLFISFSTKMKSISLSKSLYFNLYPKKLNQIINKFPQKISSAPVPHSKSTTICYEACFISIITLPITTYIMFTYVSKKVYPLKLLFFCCLLQTAYLLYFQISPRLIF